MSQRAWLFWVWAVGYIACLVLLLVFVMRDEAKSANFPDYLSSLTSVYLPYLGSIIAFWVSTQPGEGRIGTAEKVAPTGPAPGATVAPGKGPNRTPRNPFWIAVIFSMIFNVVVLLLLIRVEFGPSGLGLIEDGLKQVSRSAAVLSVFTGPAVGYFFGKAR